MTRYLLLPISLTLLLAVTSVAVAQTAEENTFVFGSDAYLAGQTVRHETPGLDDVFAVGQQVRIASDVTGSVHAAGQSVTVETEVGGDAYLAAQDLSVSRAVAGDMTAAAQDMQLSGPLGGDLRAAAATLSLNGPVAGNALVGAGEFQLGAAISGDLSLAAETVEFRDGAAVGGTLTLYEEDIGALDVPESVIPAERIDRRQIEEWEETEFREEFTPDPGAVVGRFLGGVVMVALLAAATAALIPDRLAAMRRTVLGAPGRMLATGFVTQSAIIGSVVILGVTLVGLLLVPAIFLLAGLTALSGYVVGAYAFGVGLLSLIGRAEPDSLGDRALAAAAGALAAGIIGLVPFLGWLFVLALLLTGLGAILREIWPARREAA